MDETINLASPYGVGTPSFNIMRESTLRSIALDMRLKWRALSL